MIKKQSASLSLYVNKYDYLHYYTRCSEVAFLSNNQIEQAINKELLEYKKYLKNKDDLNEDDNNNDELEVDTQDAYSTYRERQFDSLIGTTNNVKNQKIIATITEGQKISELAKKFLIHEYKVDVVIDYDSKKYDSLKADPLLAFKQTENDINKLLSQHKTFILFQPTFISQTPNHTSFMTKCDCLVYLNKKQCYLIQIKGTTSSCLIHYLDLVYQSYVLKDLQILSITNYYLCLAKYCQAAKNTIPFIISPYINLTKTAPIIMKDKLPIAFKDLIALKQRYKLGKEQLVINDVLHNNLNSNQIYDFYKSNGCSDKSAANFTKMLINKCNTLYTELNLPFYEVIDSLSKKKENFTFHQRIIQLLPCANCKSKYQNCLYWSKCKQLFKDKYLAGKKQFYPFLFSATVFERNLQFAAYNEMNLTNNDCLDPKFIKQEYQCFLNGESHINQQSLTELWNQLQSRHKKIYFNFSTLNTVIRSMDDVFPFSQLVVQCAISKVMLNVNKSIDENLIVDPKKINLSWLKSVINHLYEGEDCWYIVYNKSFEITRLQEISNLLPDEDIKQKIKCICNNLFELSSFFGKTPKPVLLEPLHGYYSLQEFANWLAIINPASIKAVENSKIISSAQASALITSRFFNLISDEEWTKDCITKLKQSCAYDIRIMKAIEQYLQKILDDLNNQLKN